MPTVATKIMIIRHGEKPPKEGGAPFGVLVDGTQGPGGGKDDLIVQGWQRAGALAALFAPAQGPAAYVGVYEGLAKPDVLYACNSGTDEGSQRPVDTITPLSQKLGVDIDKSFTQDDFAPMIAAAMGQKGTVLICWEHKRIEKITRLIPRHGAPPDKFDWPGTRFDVVFVFDLDGDKYRFRQVPQRLLAGDLPDPIDLSAPDPPSPLPTPPQRS